MKLTEFLAVISCISIILVHSESTSSSNDDQLFLERASAQLERLAPYRRNNQAEIQWDPEQESSRASDLPKSSRYNRALALDLFELLPEEMKKQLTAGKRLDNEKDTINFIVDPKYTDLMQERIKRSGLGLGSGSFVSSIASGVIGGIASASSGASRGSAGSLSGGSSNSGGDPHAGYGPPEHGHSHEQTLTAWDLKKAILNTLLQAIKAIGGGVLALKGQLIKGGGFLISAKGRLISGTGDAISSLGRQIASKAVVAHPNPTYYHHDDGGYVYNPGTVQHVVDHETEYHGLPPTHDYSSYNAHSHYPAPSDETDQAGLLIATPTKTEHNHKDDHRHGNTLDLVKPQHNQQQLISDLRDSFGGPVKGSFENEHHNQENNLDPLYPPLGQAPDNLENSKDHHPLKIKGVVTLLDNNSPVDVKIQQSVEYPPIQITSSPSLPNNNHFDVLKIPILDNQPLSYYPTTNSLHLPKLQSQMDFYTMPNSYGGLSHTQEPSQLPSLNPISDQYWHNTGPYYPMNYDIYGQIQKRNSYIKRRYARDFLRRSKRFGLPGRGSYPLN